MPWRVVDDDHLLELAAGVLAGYRTDEHLGDTTERFQTALWLATRGRRGRDWGIRAPGDPRTDPSGDG